MTHPVVHAEIRSTDPDATRAFFAGLFGWSYSDGAYPGYTFVDPAYEGALPTAISPDCRATPTRCSSSSACRTSRPRSRRQRSWAAPSFSRRRKCRASRSAFSPIRSATRSGLQRSSNRPNRIPLRSE